MVALFSFRDSASARSVEPGRMLESSRESLGSKMAKSKKDRLKEARAHLARARVQWDRAAVDSWEPADPAECVTKCFYAYENGVVAAATALGTAWTKKHYEKAALAKRLFEQNKLKTDVSDRLAELNELRKDVSYGDPGEQLLDIDLEDLVSDLERFLDEVDELVNSEEES
jgi:hypothetical protein